MGPEWMLEGTLAVAGIAAAAVAVSRLLAGERSAALRFAVASLLLFSVAVALGRSERLHNSWRARGGRAGVAVDPLALKPAAPIRPAPDASDSADAMSLRLGDVTIRVARSERYVLSVDGQPFLTLDSTPSGLVASGEAAGPSDNATVRIRRNAFDRQMPGITASRPDTSTLRVTEREMEIVRIHYATPRTIEILGRFYVPEGSESFLISRLHGIQWRGGSVPAGSRIDLTQQGTGEINFERNGMIQIVPRGGREVTQP